MKDSKKRMRKQLEMRLVETDKMMKIQEKRSQEQSDSL